MAKRRNMGFQILFNDYYARLKNIAMSVFKWEGLPETCNERYLEECLYKYGCAIFVEDAEMSFLNLQAAAADTLNVYNEPTGYTAYSTGYTKWYDSDNCVFIRNNYMAKSTDCTIAIYAERLAKIDLAIGVNINAQKTPILIRCDDKTKLTLETVYNQYDGDRPVIFGAKSLSEKPLEAIETGAPFVADKLREEKRMVWNEALEFLGINTNPADKKRERLIVSEVASNNEQIDMQAETMLLCREMACEEINKKYGLSVSVKKRLDDLKPVESEVEEVG